MALFSFSSNYQCRSEIRVFSLKMHAYASVNVGVGGRLCVRMTSGENDSKLQISTSFDSLRELRCVLKRGGKRETKRKRQIPQYLTLTFLFNFLT